MRYHPDPGAPADDHAVWEAAAVERSIATSMSGVGEQSINRAVDTARKAAAVQREAIPKPRRIRIGKANTAPSPHAEAADAWEAVADDYPRAIESLAAGVKLLQDCARRARELSLSPRREKLYGNTDARVEWRGDTAYMNDIMVARRTRRNHVGMWCRADERIKWQSATGEMGVRSSLESIVMDAFRREALEPIPCDADWTNP